MGKMSSSIVQAQSPSSYGRRTAKIPHADKCGHPRTGMGRRADGPERERERVFRMRVRSDAGARRLDLGKLTPVFSRPRGEDEL